MAVYWSLILLLTAENCGGGLEVKSEQRIGGGYMLIICTNCSDDLDTVERGIKKFDKVEELQSLLM